MGKADQGRRRAEACPAAGREVPHGFRLPAAPRRKPAEGKTARFKLRAVSMKNGDDSAPLPGEHHSRPGTGGLPAPSVWHKTPQNSSHHCAAAGKSAVAPFSLKVPGVRKLPPACAAASRNRRGERAVHVFHQFREWLRHGGGRRGGSRAPVPALPPAYCACGCRRPWRGLPRRTAPRRRRRRRRGLLNAVRLG